MKTNLNAELLALYVRLGGIATPEGRALRALFQREKDFREALEWYAGPLSVENRLNDNGERATAAINKYPKQ